MEKSAKIDKFEQYCIKCGSGSPDCDKAFQVIYDLLKERDKYEEVVAQGLDSVLRSCGDNKCGTAINDYMQLKKYIL